MSAPLVIIATENVSTALRDWTAQTEALGRGAAVAIAALIITFLLIIRLLTREHKATAALLKQERNRFALAVNNMTQGLLLFDGDHRPHAMQRPLSRNVQPDARHDQTGLHAA